jgi:hypothetical protein
MQLRRLPTILRRNPDTSIGVLSNHRHGLRACVAVSNDRFAALIPELA